MHLRFPDLRLTLIVLLILHLSFWPIFGQKAVTSKTGLELSNSVTIPVQIAFKDDPKSGLTTERIEAHVDTALRKNGLKPTEMNSDAVPSPYLLVALSLYGSAFHLQIEFRRVVTYTDGKTDWSLYATTWKNGATGTYASLNKLMELVEEQSELFANAFLKANGK